MAYLAQGVSFVATPARGQPGEVLLRDPKDQPILRAAVAAGADVILTGDKDLLDAELTHPRVMSPAAYLGGSD
ncbi:MAG: hypothetical protein FWD29_06870 [Micrococcales bacterium]|nr:hypothetical protein [Micrococcales bacterium]